MDPQEDITDRDIILSILLPGGQQTTATVHSSKPVIDILVILCAQHRLVPSDHVIKLISTNQNHISFKPNSPIGSLEFEKVVLEVKGNDDANRKKPHVPVPTVRLLINYKKSHKAVVRVNPRVPLLDLMPSVCEKCEFNPDITVLLKTRRSEEPLDLNKTLNDHGIKELYAKEIKVVSSDHFVDPVSSKDADGEQKTPIKTRKEKGNKGFFSLFKKSKKTSKQALSVSARGSSEPNGHSMLPMTVDMQKKRPAPRPPLMTSQSVTCELTNKDFGQLSEGVTSGKQSLLSRISSESSLKRTKRKAPPPPSDGPTPSDADNKENVEDDDNGSDKYRSHIADRCPAIAELMTELMKSLQTRQRTLSSEISFTSQHQTTEDSPCSSSEAPPDCQLLKNSCEREGLTTFTVVPQRCQLSRRSFEVSQTTDTAQTEPELSLNPPEHPEIQTDEHFRNDVLEKSLESLQCLEKEEQAWTDDKRLSIHLKNITQEDLESFKMNLKPVCSKMKNNIGNPQLIDTLASESSKETQEYDLKRNWFEEYNERRRKFLDDDEEEEEEEEDKVEEEEEEEEDKEEGDDDCGKRNIDALGKINSESSLSQMKVDDYFPSPPPPVCWDEKTMGDQVMDEAQTRNPWPNTEHHFDQDKNHKLNHSTQTHPDPDTCSSNSSSVPKALDCSSKSHSPFALAVFQKAKHGSPGMDPKHSKR